MIDFDTFTKNAKEDLGKLIVAKGFKSCPGPINHLIWSHWSQRMYLIVVSLKCSAWLWSRKYVWVCNLELGESVCHR